MRTAMLPITQRSTETTNMKRSDAAKVLSTVAVEAASQGNTYLLEVLAGAGVTVEKCAGEAHGNPHIDNCGQCAPNWGWIVKGCKVT